MAWHAYAISKCCVSPPPPPTPPLPATLARMLNPQNVGWGKRSPCRSSDPSRLPLAFLSGPRCSPINTDSIIMHRTSHSRCGCSAEKRWWRREARWEDQVADGAMKRIKVQQHKKGGVGQGRLSRHLCQLEAAHAVGKISQPVNGRNSLRQGSNKEINHFHDKTSPFKLQVFWFHRYDWAPHCTVTLPHCIRTRMHARRRYTFMKP